MDKIRTLLGALILAGLYRLLSLTWRFRHVDLGPRREPRVFAHWHGDELLLVGAYLGQGMTVMASRSKDGELMKRLLGRLGYHVVRGSSSRGGAAGLKGLIDSVRHHGRDGSLAVDGPRGPLHRVKPGILKLAQQTGAELIPGAAAASRRFVFKKAWNRCYLPYPFARCVIVYGRPLKVPPQMTAEEEEALRQHLERELNDLKARAETLVGRPAALRPAFESIGV